VAEWLAERGSTVDPSTSSAWVQTFTPCCITAARAYRTPVGQRWWADETYLKIDGRWRYVVRAIDEHGQIIDVYLSDRRNAAAARTFFESAIQERGGTPIRVTTDKAKSYPPHAAQRGALGRASIFEILKQRTGTGPSAFERPGAPDATLQGPHKYKHLLSRAYLNPNPGPWIFAADGRDCASVAARHGVGDTCCDPLILF